MKIVVACDKYKGSLSAVEVCNIIKSAIVDADKRMEVAIKPMADGGEGTVETMVESLGGKMVAVPVRGPLGKEVMAQYGIIGDGTAVIEMSSASGIALMEKSSLNPMETTTYGTGQLIDNALQKGCSRIIIGIGGSATNDGGMGMAQALGVKFYSRKGQQLGFGGKQLIQIERIDMSGLNPKIRETVIEVACDVDNPLTGPQGAAYIYAPQKGATPEMVKELDQGLKKMARAVKKDIGMDIDQVKGAGAAGGLGAGLAAFLGAILKPGTDIIMEAIGLRQSLEGASLVITGEGAMDRQTFFGKSAYGVARTAREAGVPVITINGSVLTSRKEVESGKASLFDGNFSIINRPMDLAQAIKDSRELVYDAATELIEFFLSIYNYKKNST
ncbi:MAG: glycerate kinase [Actinomycetota bacterium]|nr:glycerate kinase [Actinomycetota bacterium]